MDKEFEINMKAHKYYMQQALAEAEKGQALAEVPVGAVLVSGTGDIIAAGYNNPISLHDPTAHSEILALREGARKTVNYRLPRTVMYVIVKLYVMCMGAIIHARVHSWCSAPMIPNGDVGSLYNFAESARSIINRRLYPACEAACRKQLQDFFEAKRKCGKSGSH